MSLVRRVRGVPLEDVMLGVAAAAVSVFLVWSVIRLGDITAAMYANSDIASAPVLAQLLPDKGSGHLVLGYYPWLESLFALDLTRWLPSHVELWKVAPFIVYAVAVVLTGWTVRRTVSPKTGVLVALAMAAPAPLVIYLLGASNQRLPTLVHAVLLAAFLVTTPSLARWRSPARAAWAAALALTLAPGIASDLLIVLGAAVPFLAAATLGWRFGLLDRGVAAVAAGACLAGVVGGFGLERLAEHVEITYVPPGWGLASPGTAVSNGWLLMKEVALFAHGLFDTGPPPVDALDVAQFGAAVAAIGVTVALAVLLLRAARPFLTDAARPPAVRMLGIYWGGSLLLVAGPFVFTTVPVGINSIRYVFTLWPALLTLAALVYARRAHLWIAILATASALIGCAELSRGFYTPPVVVQPTPAEVAALERVAAANDIDHGYASYWDAMPITLESDFKLRAYPIEPCGAVGYCPFTLHVIESWYSPKPGTRSFYVVGDQSLKPSLGPPPASWGRPLKIVRIGHLTVYLFDYDVASRLMPFKPGELAAPERDAAAMAPPFAASPVPG
jgi:hypothetical protein